MVQFKPADGLEEYHKRRSNTYWMLGSPLKRTAREIREDLEKRGYQCRKNATKSVLAESFGRMQRGLLCYDKCTAAQLRSFANVAGLRQRRRLSRTLLESLKNQMTKSLSRDSSSYLPRFAT